MTGTVKDTDECYHEKATDIISGAELHFPFAFVQIITNLVDIALVSLIGIRFIIVIHGIQNALNVIISQGILHLTAG